MPVVDSIFYILAFGLAFSLVGLGIFLSNKVFKLVDLTCESSFALGACVYGSMVLAGMNPMIAIITSMFLGYIAGAITASFINYIKLDAIVASLLTIGGLQSLLTKLVEVRRVNSFTVFGNLSPISNFILVLMIVCVVLFLFYRLMISEYGLSMRIYGDGEIITESMGVNGIRVLSFGLGLENLLCALAGALVAQMTGDFSVNMGSGCIIFGISAIIFGSKIFNSTNIKTAVIGTFLGAVCYQAAIKLVVSKELIGVGDEYTNVLMAITLIMLVALKRSNYTDDTREN
ncbi:MAG: hypothetical protein J5821_02540 [Alphaproteobacteria bacterium]|nr:hypothetical protein [Alphaproteobacteria bacterium]